MTSARSATSTAISEAWPISYTDLEPYYTRAEQLYHVHGERKVDPLEPWTTGPFPYPAMSHEPRVEQLSADLDAAGLHPFHLPFGIMIDEAIPCTARCIRCDTCDGFPCMVYAKADAQVVCVEPALQYPTSRCAPTPTSAGWRPTATGARSPRWSSSATGSARSTPPTSSSCRPAPSTPPHCCCARPTSATRTGSATAPAWSAAT